VSLLTRLDVRDAADVFAARQLGRLVAGELLLDRQDQVRVATALSEISRAAVVAGQRAAVEFELTPETLVLTMRLDRDPPADAVAAVRRLMDSVTVDSVTPGLAGGADTVVRMAKRRPAGVQADPAAISAHLAAVHPASALDELRRQNQDLISALNDLQVQKDQLLRLNSELEETNQGVMALYGQLSDELEQTNRGVVALYAELDEKSERLRVALESKDRFWAHVSHELRTPLNSIIGLTRLLAGPDGGGLDADQRHQVDLIQTSGRTLLALVNDLLDTAKAESGRVQIDPAEVELPALLGRLRALLRPVASDRAVDVVVADAGAPATVLTDELALTAILRNLLSNGIKYSDGGEVRLSVQTDETSVAISVADTGIGIPAALQGHVFEEFYQVPGVRRGGTGLGLPYARRLARLLGGDLTLVSEPGRGTTVTLTLPHGPARVGTVLVSDDDESFRAVLRGLLAGLADRIIETGDGRQALAVLASEHVDLLLADMMMPDVDGPALLAQLPGAVPVIVVTGLDVERPRRAVALLRKDELTRERLAFAVRNASRAAS
jgi:signal transduction histidine kinase/CheY-like chemotaxis protein